MELAFEHAFVPSHYDSVFNHLRGSSNVDEGADGPVRPVLSILRAGNGTEVGRRPSGSAIAATVETWLEMAGVRLNDFNTNLTAGARRRSERRAAVERPRLAALGCGSLRLAARAAAAAAAGCGSLRLAARAAAAAAAGCGSLRLAARRLRTSPCRV